MRREQLVAETRSPDADPPRPGSALPPTYTPASAGFARGPFLDPQTVTPTSLKWNRARVYHVHAVDGRDYYALRVFTGPRKQERRDFVGWWAIEERGVPLFDLGWSEGDA